MQQTQSAPGSIFAFRDGLHQNATDLPHQLGLDEQRWTPPVGVEQTQVHAPPLPHDQQVVTELLLQVPAHRIAQRPLRLRGQQQMHQPTLLGEPLGEGLHR